MHCCGPVSDFVAFSATTQIHKAATLFFLALVGAGLGVGISVASNDARDAADADEIRRTAISSEWHMKLTSRFTQAASLSATIGGFATGLVTEPTNMSAPAHERALIRVNEVAYARLCQQVIIGGVAVLGLSPGGTVAQYYPPNSSTYGTDMLTRDAYKPIFAKMVSGNFKNGESLITGPSKLTTMAGYGIFAWFPVFVNDNHTKENFWGAAFVRMFVSELVNSLNVSDLVTVHGLDYVFWFVTDLDPTPVILEESGHNRELAMQEGIRIALPIAEPGRSSFLAMYPRSGLISSTISAGLAVGITAAVLAIAALFIAAVYLGAFGYFMYRHRYAPCSGAPMYMAALTLRGAQPIADRAPLEAVRMFEEFISRVREEARDHKCYTVCEIGDRTVYMVSKTPDAITALVKKVVFDISIHGNAANHSNETQQQPEEGRSLSSPQLRSTSNQMRSASNIMDARSKGRVTSQSSSSFIGAAICRPSAAMHAVAARFAYDALRDVYFYGQSSQVGTLCGVLDGTKGGEVGWTPAFEAAEEAANSRRVLKESSVSNHIVSEGNEVRLHIASLWKAVGGGGGDNDGDDDLDRENSRDNEDPPVAMAVLSDVYVTRMVVIVSEGRAIAKASRRNAGGGGGGSTKGSESTDKSTEATSITRQAALLNIAILDDARIPLDTIRQVVAGEKGVVVSGQENVITVAFNLLSPGGHHQARAANAVLLLRAALVNTPFVCALHHGRVSALVADGLVMCSGETVATARTLLQRAVTLRESTSHASPTSLQPVVSDEVNRFPSVSSNTVKPFNASKSSNVNAAGFRANSIAAARSGGENGLCCDNNCAYKEVFLTASGLDRRRPCT